MKNKLDLQNNTYILTIYAAGTASDNFVFEKFSMKKCLIKLSVVQTFLMLCCMVCAETVLVAEKQLKPTADHRRTTTIITRLLSNYHYKAMPLNDSFSANIIDKFTESLDPMRLYFSRSDIEHIHKRRYMFDDYLNSANMNPFFDVFKAYRRNLLRQTEFALQLIEVDFDFTINESLELDRKDLSWATNQAELNELWRKRIKNEYLNMKLAGKKDSKEIRKTLVQRYQGLQRRTKQLNSDDVYQIAINAYTSGIDPHTTYFTPRSTENFKISMSLSLEGIGAVLQNKDEHTVIRKVVPGGPADLSGKLFPDDRIVSIGQTEEEGLTDVVGWRLDDVVDLIRGPKGSEVLLEILPKKESLGGPTRIVKIVRDEIKLEEQAAKSHILSLPNTENKIGVIEIPTFYLDFEGRKSGKKDYKSTTRDVRDLINELKNEQVEGILVDVRGNGGGSLSEATSLTGLFIESGPVVQIQDYTGSIEIEKDPEIGTFYSGPLVVLVDRNSASASEIFAGAVQDYNRGIIVGEPTYGKGTVQNLVDLNRYTRSSDNPLGQLKATMAQFFRVSGESTQHRGVMPDITFKGLKRPKDHGERGLANALPWARIKEIPHNKLRERSKLISELSESHALRVKNDRKIQYVYELEEQTLAAKEKTTLSLLEEARQIEYDSNKEEQTELENKFRALYDLPLLKKNLNQGLSENDSNIEEDETDLYDDPSYDAILLEAAQILSEMHYIIETN